jgi:hypothetical protein
MNEPDDVIAKRWTPRTKGRSRMSDGSKIAILGGLCFGLAVSVIALLILIWMITPPIGTTLR